MKRITLIPLLFFAVSVFSQPKMDTVKCYVQIMVPASGTIGMSRNIEDNQVFINGGILLYTKAYAIKENGKYIKFLTIKKKELKDIWWPDGGPLVMKKDW